MRSKLRTSTKDFHKDKQMFDNSNYLESSPFYFKDNKKIIGKMKDEAAGCKISEFFAAKCTAISKTARAAAEPLRKSRRMSSRR